MRDANCAASNSAMGLMPLSPFSSASHVAFVVKPHGLTTPTPVTTTRRIDATISLAEPLPVPFALTRPAGQRQRGGAIAGASGASRCSPAYEKATAALRGHRLDAHLVLCSWMYDTASPTVRIFSVSSSGM